MSVINMPLCRYHGREENDVAGGQAVDPCLFPQQGAIWDIKKLVQKQEICIPIKEHFDGGKWCFKPKPLYIYIIYRVGGTLPWTDQLGNLMEIGIKCQCGHKFTSETSTIRSYYIDLSNGQAIPRRLYSSNSPGAEDPTCKHSCDRSESVQISNPSNKRGALQKQWPHTKHNVGLSENRVYSQLYPFNRDNDH